MKHSRSETMTTIQTMIFAAALCLCAYGCTSVKYSRIEPAGEKVSFSTVSFATKKTLGPIDLSITTNSKSLKIEGYTNDQVSAVGIAVDAAVKAAIKSVVPVP